MSRNETLVTFVRKYIFRKRNKYGNYSSNKFILKVIKNRYSCSNSAIFSNISPTNFSTFLLLNNKKSALTLLNLKIKTL